MIIAEYLRPMKNRLLRAFQPKPQYDVIAGAQALVDAGVIDGHECDDPRYKEFLDAAYSIDDSNYHDSIKALRLLSDAGSQDALLYRCGPGANRMGDAFFKSGHYVPSVIEHSVAYINGNQGVFRTLSWNMESGIRKDVEGFGAAVDFLRDLPEHQNPDEILRGGMTLNFIPSQMVEETVRLWQENPEISKVLAGDLTMYRAQQASFKGQGKNAYSLYSDAVGAGLTRIDRDEWFNAIFNPGSEPTAAQ